MLVLVTGATGFIGRHLIPELLNRGHKVMAISRDQNKAQTMPWFKEVQYFAVDLDTLEVDFLKNLSVPDILVHLAWKGLPNYNSLFHFEENLFTSYNFIKKMVQIGVKQVLVTGTCFEYGIQYGPLSEDLVTNPVTAYGLAKDTLRKFLQQLNKKIPFILQWVRLFYLFGPGQNPNSLLEQLNMAIKNQQEYFYMSKGDQLRDYLSVEDAAQIISKIIEHPELTGIINCCSGRPVSVRSLVEDYLKKKNSKIKLYLGYYEYPDYEPLAFWGTAQKLNKLKEI